MLEIGEFTFSEEMRDTFNFIYKLQNYNHSTTWNHLDIGMRAKIHNST